MKTKSRMKPKPVKKSIQFSYLQYKLLISLFLLLGCKKNATEPAEIFTRPTSPEGSVVYDNNILNGYSSVNKTTSWFQTTTSFTAL